MNTLNRALLPGSHRITEIHIGTNLMFIVQFNALNYDFGSELVDLRHLDLLNDAYWSKLTEKVKVAIHDIIPYEESSVSIDRVYEDSNFQVETLRISILENGQFIDQYYCF